MSVHKTLKTKGKLVRMRNVLNRWERIEKLVGEERWSPEEDSVFGLPKVRVLKIKKRGKEAKKKKEEEEAAPKAEPSTS